VSREQNIREGAPKGASPIDPTKGDQENDNTCADIDDRAWVDTALRWRDREDRAYYQNRSARWWSREYKRAGVS
jgi:hypothetical protein